MKKRLLAFLLIAMGVGVINTSSPKVASASYNIENWRHVKVAGENPYTITEDVITVDRSKSQSMLNNFLVTDEYQAIGEYEVSVKIQGTMTFPNDRETAAGIIPWYIDDRNYIMAYLNWADHMRPNELREIQITGLINGRNPIVWKNGWVEASWNDIWTDGRSIESTEEIDFKIVRKLSESKDSYIFYAYINNEEIGFYSFREQVQHTSKPAAIGVYGLNDDFTFKNFTYNNLNTQGEYVNLETGVVAKSSDSSWVKEENSYSIATGDATWSNQMLIKKNAIQQEKYKVSTNVNVTTETDNSAIGLLAWYQDEYNYLGAVIRKENGILKAGFEGKTTALASITMTVNEISQLVDLNQALTSINSLAVVKSGSKYTLLVNGAEVVSYTNLSLLSYNKYGLLAANTNVTYSNLICEEVAYTPYDWYTSKLGTGTTYYISANTDTNAISYADGTYTFNAAGVSSDSTKRTSIYFPSGKYNHIAVSAIFANVKETTIYGIYGWIEDADNYLSVEVTPSGIVVTNHFGSDIRSQTFSLRPGLSYTGGNKTLSVEILDGYVNVTWQGYKAVKNQDFAISGNNNGISPNVGLICGVDPVVVSEVTVTGFSSYNPITRGDWTLYGSRYDTWTIDEANTTVVGKWDGGTTFKRTYALYPQTTEKDFIMSSVVNVTDTTASEFKVGLVPYYKDSGNNIIVWLSQWAGAAPNITVTGWLNGKCVGYEWREQKCSYNFMNANNKLEVEVVGDEVRVYLNQSFNPTFTTTFDGLSQRNLEGAFVGFNIFNVTAEFKEYTMCGHERKFVLNSKPTISESNKRVTEAVLGDTVKLPIFTATNDAGDILNAVVKVTDPDGIVLEIERNRFVAEKLGKYHVNVTCVDNWGNEADPIDYDITILESLPEPGPGTTDPTTPPTEDPGTDPAPSGKGCGKSGTNVITVIGLITVLGLVVLKKKD